MRKPDYDLEEALTYNPQEGFGINDIVDTLAEVAGENDGADYYWVVKLKDGRFVLIQGDCDYTGWDCQSSATSKFATTALKAAKLAPEKEEYYDRGNIRNILIKQLKGELHYGVSDLSK